MKENRFNYKLINITALMLLLYITVSNIGTWYNILIRVVQIILPFIIAFTVAYSLTPFIKWLQKKSFPKWLAILIVVLGLVFILGFILAATLPLVYDQLISLSENVGEVTNVISNKFDINLGGFEDNITSLLNNLIKDTGSIISSKLSKSIGSIGSFIVGFVASIYFLVYMDNIRHEVKIFLNRRSKRTLNYLRKLDLELGNYIKGLITFMVIEFFEYSILFKIVNHPNWLILGILACVMTVIPYFGGLITNVIALALASVTTPYTFFGTLIICAIFPQIDGYFTSPKVYGKTNNINPLITIMAVSVGGTIAGSIGIIAALPVYLVIRTTYNYFKSDLKETVKNLKETI